MNTTEFTTVARPAEEAKDIYDRLCPFYDLLTSFGERELTHAALHELRVREGEKVLEIGFGTGNALLHLAQCVGKSGYVHGIDISGEMCRAARRKVEQAGLGDRVTVKVGDARNLPYAEGEFDAVFLSFTLELFDTPDIPTVLQQCRRVLRDGGRVAVVSLSKDQELTAAGRLYEWLHVKFPRHLDCRPIPTQRLLQEARFQLLETAAKSLWGLPVAIVLAKKRTEEGNT